MVARIPVRRRQARRKSSSARHALPQPWENGPAVREIKSAADLTARFDVYLTPEIKKQIASKRPERLPNDNYIIIWHARGNEYSLHFAPSGNSFALDGLAEGPP